MDDPALAQRRERYALALSNLQRRFLTLFSEDVVPRLLAWLNDRIEEDKTEAINSALSHFEPEEKIEFSKFLNSLLPSILRENQQPHEIQNAVSEKVKKLNKCPTRI